MGCQPYPLQSLFSGLEDIAYISSALILSCEYTVISFSEIVIIRTDKFVASKIASNIEILGVTCKIHSWCTKEKQPRAVQRWGLKTYHLKQKASII